MLRRRICKALVEQPRFAENELGLSPRQWPEWLMLLDLYAIEQQEMEEGFRQFTRASGMSETTAFRRTIELINAGVLDRIPHPHDRRRSFIRLSAETRTKMDEVMDGLAALLFA